MKLLAGILLIVSSVLALLVPNAYSAPDLDETNADWSPSRTVAVPSESGKVKGFVRTRPLPRKEGQEKDEVEARAPVINLKMLFVPSKHLLWVGASEYECFFILKGKIFALLATARADLSISASTVQMPKSDDDDKEFLEDLDRQFKKVAER